MKMTLREVSERLCADEETKWDTLTPRHRLRLQQGRLFFAQMSPTNFPKGLALTNWATTQLCQKVNVPTAYFRRCPSFLQDAQFNHWVWKSENEKDAEEEWLLRMKGDRLRGILSKKYTRLDNTEVAQAIETLCKDRFQVEWLAVTDESLHLRLVDPTLSRSVLPGDKVCAGIHIGNSEVGKRAVTVDALVWRLVCENGLVRLVKGRSLLYQRHIHLSKPMLHQALGNVISEALVQSTGFMERMAQATAETVPKMDEAIAALSSHWNLSEETSRKVEDAVKTEPFGQKDTLYGLVNAFTQTAQTLQPDDRYSLEVFSGNLLERGLPLIDAYIKERPQKPLDDFAPQLALT